MLIALNSLNEKHTNPLILGQMIKYFPNFDKKSFYSKVETFLIIACKYVLSTFNLENLSSNPFK